MDKQLLEKTVRQLAGHLVVETDSEKRNLETLYKSLGQTDLSLKREQLSRPGLSIEKADLFFDDTIPKNRFADLDLVVKNQIEDGRKKMYRMFVRDVPIQEHLLQASLPDWAAGSKVDHSIGPFLNKDGRKFWYDFFPIIKLISLYIQGDTTPALLFNIRANPGDPLLKQYSIIKGTIWINSKFLAPTAPAGSFIGLTIDGGRLSLSKNPVKQSGKLTVTADTEISLRLALKQPEKIPGPISIFGVDAKNLKLELPKNLALHFSGQGRTIEEVGDGAWNLYGDKLKFSWNEAEQTLYDPILKRVVVPFKADRNKLQIKSCASPFNTVSGTAPIEKSGWTLPVASIDINQPTEAAGIGEMMVKTGSGIVDNWPNLQGSGLNLTGPTFLVNSSQILIADLTKGNPHASHSLNLWRDELNSFGTKLKMTFPSPALFLYLTNANGNELLSTFANCDFQIDRPVKVNGEPPEVRVPPPVGGPQYGARVEVPPE